MHSVKGRMRIYQPAQKPATGKAMNHRMRNQMILHKMLPPPSPAPIFDPFFPLFIILQSTIKSRETSVDLNCVDREVLSVACRERLDNFKL